MSTVLTTTQLKDPKSSKKHLLLKLSYPSFRGQITEHLGDIHRSQRSDWLQAAVIEYDKASQGPTSPDDAYKNGPNLLN